MRYEHSIRDQYLLLLESLAFIVELTDRNMELFTDLAGWETVYQSIVQACDCPIYDFLDASSCESSPLDIVEFGIWMLLEYSLNCALYQENDLKEVTPWIMKLLDTSFLTDAGSTEQSNIENDSGIDDSFNDKTRLHASKKSKNCIFPHIILKTLSAITHRLVPDPSDGEQAKLCSRIDEVKTILKNAHLLEKLISILSLLEKIQQIHFDRLPLISNNDIGFGAIAVLTAMARFSNHTKDYLLQDLGYDLILEKLKAGMKGDLAREPSLWYFALEVATTYPENHGSCLSDLLMSQGFQLEMEGNSFIDSDTLSEPYSRIVAVHGQALSDTTLRCIQDVNTPRLLYEKPVPISSLRNKSFSRSNARKQNIDGEPMQPLKTKKAPSVGWSRLSVKHSESQISEYCVNVHSGLKRGQNAPSYLHINASSERLLPQTSVLQKQLQSTRESKELNCEEQLSKRTLSADIVVANGLRRTHWSSSSAAPKLASTRMPSDTSRPSSKQSKQFSAYPYIHRPSSLRTVNLCGCTIRDAVSASFLLQFIETLQQIHPLNARNMAFTVLLLLEIDPMNREMLSLADGAKSMLSLYMNYLMNLPATSDEWRNQWKSPYQQLIVSLLSHSVSPEVVGLLFDVIYDPKVMVRSPLFGKLLSLGHVEPALFCSILNMRLSYISFSLVMTLNDKEEVGQISSSCARRIQNEIAAILELISTRPNPKHYFSFNGLSGVLKTSPIEKFPGIKSGYSVSCWLKPVAFMDTEIGFLTIEEQANEGMRSSNLFEIYFKQIPGIKSQTNASNRPPRTNYDRSATKRVFLCIRAEHNPLPPEDFVFDNFDFFQHGYRRWTNVAFVHSKLGITLYINGEPIQTCSTFSYPKTNSNHHPFVAIVGVKQKFAKKSSMEEKKETENLSPSTSWISSFWSTSSTQASMTKKQTKEVTGQLIEYHGHYFGLVGPVYFAEGVWDATMIRRMFNAGPTLSRLSKQIFNDAKIIHYIIPQNYTHEHQAPYAIASIPPSSSSSTRAIT